MKVSVIIPCKNRLQHLKESLPLVLSQSYNDLEVIVVDYNCPQQSGKWARSIGAKVVDCMVGKDEWSLSAARNTGYKFSSGEMLLFLDADALLIDKHFIEKHVKHCVDGSFICGYGWHDATGCCMLRRTAFVAADGYNELITSWGAEDIKLYNTLENALSQERRTWLGGIETIKHGDEIRNYYHGHKPPLETNEQNFAIEGHKGLKG